MEKLIKMRTALMENNPVIANAPFLNRNNRCKNSTIKVRRSVSVAGKSKNESTNSPFIN